MDYGASFWLFGLSNNLNHIYSSSSFDLCKNQVKNHGDIQSEFGLYFWSAQKPLCRFWHDSLSSSLFFLIQSQLNALNKWYTPNISNWLSSISRQKYFFYFRFSMSQVNRAVPETVFMQAVVLIVCQTLHLCIQWTLYNVSCITLSIDMILPLTQVWSTWL